MSENASPLPTVREHALAQLRQPRVYDMAIVGGGATGLGAGSSIWKPSRIATEMAIARKSRF